MAIAGVQKDIGVLGAQDAFHALLTRGNGGGHPGVRQIGHGPLHGVHDFVGHMGGAGRVYKTNARNAGRDRRGLNHGELLG